jgi:hypothetical protein
MSSPTAEKLPAAVTNQLRVMVERFETAFAEILEAAMRIDPEKAAELKDEVERTIAKYKAELLALNDRK